MEMINSYTHLIMDLIDLVEIEYKDYIITQSMIFILHF